MLEHYATQLAAIRAWVDRTVTSPTTGRQGAQTTAYTTSGEVTVTQWIPRALHRAPTGG